jgi:hypothetical protein
MNDSEKVRRRSIEESNTSSAENGSPVVRAFCTREMDDDVVDETISNDTNTKRKNNIESSSHNIVFILHIAPRSKAPTD